MTGYDVLRDGAVVGSVGGSTTSFTDAVGVGSTTYSYTVRARDASNNVSAPSTAASGDDAGGADAGVRRRVRVGEPVGVDEQRRPVVESTDVRTGGFAAEGNTTNGNTFARKTLSSTFADGYGRVAFELKSQVVAGEPAADARRGRELAGLRLREHDRRARLPQRRH